MSRNGRKEVTVGRFKGVATDGGFVFVAYIEGRGKKTKLKAIAYEDGVIEIAIDCAESISKVAEVVSGMFSKKSNFLNLESVILNYNNIRLQIGRNTGRKDIICMFMKAVSVPDCKVQYVHVDTEVCKIDIPLRDSDKLGISCRVYDNTFKFDEIFKWGKSLWFRNPYTGKSLIILSIKDGIVTVDTTAGGKVPDFVRKVRGLFNPYSNFYGVKAVEVEINEFSIRMDEQNAGRILALYYRSREMNYGLQTREIQENYNSPEYVRNHANMAKN